MGKWVVYVLFFVPDVRIGSHAGSLDVTERSDGRSSAFPLGLAVVRQSFRVASPLGLPYCLIVRLPIAEATARNAGRSGEVERKAAGAGAAAP